MINLISRRGNYSEAKASAAKNDWRMARRHAAWPIQYHSDGG
jgi:hypothetical protein